MIECSPFCSALVGCSISGVGCVSIICVAGITSSGGSSGGVKAGGGRVSGGDYKLKNLDSKILKKRERNITYTNSYNIHFFFFF